MERAPLRPVPARPAGPVAPAAASRALGAALPELDDREAEALALVALAGRPRREVAGELGIAADELAQALASARKALRRSLLPLTASGWCERAERLISDRLDGELDDRGAARLDVHLRNCPRCVEHERRLVQATDALLASASGPAPPPPAATVSPVELAVVAAAEPEASAEPAPARSGRQRASAAAWTLLVVVAVILAVASLALIVAGVLGADL
jgi:Putative zinc-finger